MSLIDKSRIEPFYNTTTSDGVIPAATQKTGTIVSSGTNVTGTGTLFKTILQVRVGDYVYAQNQVRKVTAIYNDTRLTVNRAFTPDIAAPVNFYVIRRTPDLTISIRNNSGGPARINTIDFDAKDLQAASTISFDSTNGAGPVAWSANGATLEISNGRRS